MSVNTRVKGTAGAASPPRDASPGGYRSPAASKVLLSSEMQRLKKNLKDLKVPINLQQSRSSLSSSQSTTTTSTHTRSELSTQHTNSITRYNPPITLKLHHSTSSGVQEEPPSKAHSAAAEDTSSLLLSTSTILHCPATRQSQSQHHQHSLKRISDSITTAAAAAGWREKVSKLDKKALSKEPSPSRNSSSLSCNERETIVKQTQQQLPSAEDKKKVLDLQQSLTNSQQQLTACELQNKQLSLTIVQLSSELTTSINNLHKQTAAEQLTSLSHQQQLLAASQESEQLLDSLNKLQKENVKLNASLKTARESLAMNGRNNNNTSSQQLLPSEFKSKWESLVTDQLSTTFINFFENPIILANITQDLFRIVYASSQRNIDAVSKSVMKVLNLSEKSLVIYSQQVNKLYQDFNKDIFGVTPSEGGGGGGGGGADSRQDERISDIIALFKAASQKIINHPYQCVFANCSLEGEQEEWLHPSPILKFQQADFEGYVEEICESTELCEFICSLYELCVYMHLNDPPLSLGTDLFEQRKFVYLPFKKTSCYLVDGFVENDAPAITVIPPVMRANQVYLGVKPSVILIPEDLLCKAIKSHVDKQIQALNHAAAAAAVVELPTEDTHLLISTDKLEETREIIEAVTAITVINQPSQGRLDEQIVSKMKEAEQISSLGTGDDLPSSKKLQTLEAEQEAYVTDVIPLIAMTNEKNGQQLTSFFIEDSKLFTHYPSSGSGFGEIPEISYSSSSSESKKCHQQREQLQPSERLLTFCEGFPDNDITSSSSISRFYKGQSTECVDVATNNILTSAAQMDVGGGSFAVQRDSKFVATSNHFASPPNPSPRPQQSSQAFLNFTKLLGSSSSGSKNNNGSSLPASSRPQHNKVASSSAHRDESEDTWSDGQSNSKLGMCRKVFESYLHSQPQLSSQSQSQLQPQQQPKQQLNRHNQSTNGSSSSSSNSFGPIRREKNEDKQIRLNASSRISRSDRSSAISSLLMLPRPSRNPSSTSVINNNQSQFSEEFSSSNRSLQKNKSVDRHANSIRSGTSPILLMQQETRSFLRTPQMEKYTAGGSGGNSGSTKKDRVLSPNVSSSSTIIQQKHIQKDLSETFITRSPVAAAAAPNECLSGRNKAVTMTTLSQQLINLLRTTNPSSQQQLNKNQQQLHLRSNSEEENRMINQASMFQKQSQAKAKKEVPATATVTASTPATSAAASKPYTFNSFLEIHRRNIQKSREVDEIKKKSSQQKENVLESVMVNARDLALKKKKKKNNLSSLSFTSAVVSPHPLQQQLSSHRSFCSGASSSSLLLFPQGGLGDSQKQQFKTSRESSSPSMSVLALQQQSYSCKTERLQRYPAHSSSEHSNQQLQQQPSMFGDPRNRSDSSSRNNNAKQTFKNMIDQFSSDEENEEEEYIKEDRSRIGCGEVCAETRPLSFNQKLKNNHHNCSSNSFGKLYKDLKFKHHFASFRVNYD